MPAVESIIAGSAPSVPPEVPAMNMESNGEVTIELDGVFDGATAWELREALDAARHKAKRIVLDFSHVREFYDFGVSVLAHGLAQRATTLPRVSLRGLRTHQLRMLRYFGVEAET